MSSDELVGAENVPMFNAHTVTKYDPVGKVLTCSCGFTVEGDGWEAAGVEHLTEAGVWAMTQPDVTVGDEPAEHPPIPVWDGILAGKVDREDPRLPETIAAEMVFRQCWAYSQEGLRCERQAGHIGNHIVGKEWGDDECMTPSGPGVASHVPVGVLPQAPAAPSGEACWACSHVHVGECPYCACKNSI